MGAPFVFFLDLILATQQVWLYPVLPGSLSQKVREKQNSCRYNLGSACLLSNSFILHLLTGWFGPYMILGFKWYILWDTWNICNYVWDRNKYLISPYFLSFWITLFKTLNCHCVVKTWNFECLQGIFIKFFINDERCMCTFT